jgi:hypothetical protein
MSKKFVFLLATGISLCVGVFAIKAHLNREAPKPSKASLLRLLSKYSSSELESLYKEAKRAKAYLHLLENKGSSLDQELKEPGQLKRSYAHCPSGNDVYDEACGLLYYFHCHRPKEEGHFHIFTVDPECSDSMRISLPQAEESFAHIIAISIDSKRHPVKLFCPNAWVTGEGMIAHEALMPYVKAFQFQDDQRSWITSAALTALIHAFSPQIEMLLKQRDARFVKLQKSLNIDAETLANGDVCEILSEVPIDLDLQIEVIKRLLF